MRALTMRLSGPSAPLAALPALVLALLSPSMGCGETLEATVDPEELAEASSPAGQSEGEGSTTTPGEVPDEVPTETEEEPEEEVIPGRAVHRMSVEQLARSIPIITGGIEWTEDFGEGEQDMLEVLSGTLGAPDYILVTQENLEPSLIIAKFMQDASLRVCAKWLAEDRDLPQDERTLVVHEDWESLDEEDVKQSLRALQLRFFARYVPEDSQDDTIDDLYELFDAASSAAPASKEADDGWLAVCLAHMTDPAMVLY